MAFDLASAKKVRPAGKPLPASLAEAESRLDNGAEKRSLDAMAEQLRIAIGLLREMMTLLAAIQKRPPEVAKPEPKRELGPVAFNVTERDKNGRVSKFVAVPRILQ